MTSVIVKGQKVGRIKASFILATESFRFLKADPEMMFLPIIGFFLNAALWLPALLIMFFGPGGGTFDGFISLIKNMEKQSIPVWMYLIIFYGCIVSVFSVACVQAGISHLVSVRSRGQNGTLGGALGLVVSILPALVLWAFIAATVGFVIKILVERSKILVAIVAGIIGAAWSVLTYFVIPAMVLERQPTVASIKRSGKVFRDSWGETIVSNISLGAFFFVLFSVLMALYIGVAVVLLGYMSVNIIFFVVASMFFMLMFFALVLFNNTLTYILKTLLYIYATEGTTASNFDAELLANMLVRKSGSTSPVPPQTSGIV